MRSLLAKHATYLNLGVTWMYLITVVNIIKPECLLPVSMSNIRYTPIMNIGFNKGVLCKVNEAFSVFENSELCNEVAFSLCNYSYLLRNCHQVC